MLVRPKASASDIYALNLYFPDLFRKNNVDMCICMQMYTYTHVQCMCVHGPVHAQGAIACFLLSAWG